MFNHANAGGVIVSYFEWVQNLQSLSWSLEEVNNKLADILLKAFDEVYGLTEERGYPMRTYPLTSSSSQTCQDQEDQRHFPVSYTIINMSRVERCGSFHFDNSLNKNVVIRKILVYNFHDKAESGALVKRSLPLI